MKVKTDISGLDDFIDEVENEVNKTIIEISHEAVDTQKIRNLSANKTYQNHTWNLRNAPGSAVIRNGEVIDMYIPADENQQEAKAKTEALIRKGRRRKNVIIIADGMEYASFVSAKGYDVVDTADIIIRNKLNVKKIWQD